MTHTESSPITAATAGTDWLRTGRLFGELQDLKRQQPAHLTTSIATDLFVRAWRQILDGHPPAAVADYITARALTNVLLPGCDETFFGPAGLNREQTAALLRKGLHATAGNRLPAALLHRLEAQTDQLAAEYHTLIEAALPTELPAALRTLCRQARAGATRPGVPRLVLLPPEMHSEHCLLTAVYAVIAAAHYGADAGTAFLAALAHHLHNAILPDCGFSGEILLGDQLSHVIDTCRARALREFDLHLRDRITAALRHHESIDAPEGRAVSAGDVLDRVLDVKWRTRAAAVTDADILEELDLVHAGPLKDFQTDLLNATQLWNTPPN